MKLTLFFSLLLLTFTAKANGQRWQDEAATGALLLADDQGHIQPATLLDTDAHITVSGPVAEVTLTQRFHNPSQQFREGRYLFPLPENAAVDGMVLTIGDRRIVGRIDRKAEAEKTYRQARASGKKASLVINYWLARKSFVHKELQKKVGEIIESSEIDVQKYNLREDRVPSELITFYVTDEGFIPSSQLNYFLERRKEDIKMITGS